MGHNLAVVPPTTLCLLPSCSSSDSASDGLFFVTIQKAQSRISMVFDLVSNKSQLLVSLNYMRMLDMCHLCMRKKRL